VHHPASTTQERRNPNPIRQHLLYGRVPILRRRRLSHEHDGSAGREKCINPGELECIGRDDGEINLRFVSNNLPSSPLRLGSTCMLAVWRSSPSQNTSPSPVSGSGSSDTSLSFPIDPSWVEGGGRVESFRDSAVCA